MEVEQRKVMIDAFENLLKNANKFVGIILYDPNHSSEKDGKGPDIQVDNRRNFISLRLRTTDTEVEIGEKIVTVEGLVDEMEKRSIDAYLHEKKNPDVFQAIEAVMRKHNVMRQYWLKQQSVSPQP